MGFAVPPAPLDGPHGVCCLLFRCRHGPTRWYIGRSSTAVTPCHCAGSLALQRWPGTRGNMQLPPGAPPQCVSQAQSEFQSQQLLPFVFEHV